MCQAAIRVPPITPSLDVVWAKGEYFPMPYGRASVDASYRNAYPAPPGGEMKSRIAAAQESFVVTSAAKQEVLDKSKADRNSRQHNRRIWAYGD